MADKIILTGLELFGRHGCSEAERKHVQPFVVDAELILDLSRAGKTDDLGDTIDYAAVLADIKKIVEGTSRNLIETVAQDVCNFLLMKYFLLDAVKIVLRKTDPPVEEKFSGAAVEITRSRAK
ncbi:MAG: dihydroneopterin aldolase [Selenomonadaceae bacterium]|nr:dihydroneopterin aldolase [Selenomonadaceae bacterium]